MPNPSSARKRRPLMRQRIRSNLFIIDLKPFDKRKAGHACLIKKNSVLEAIEVGQVLWPGNGAFVSDQRVSAQNGDRNSIERCRNFTGKRFLRAHPADPRQQIDSVWCASKLDNVLGLEEISFREPGLPK